MVGIDDTEKSYELNQIIIQENLKDPAFNQLIQPLVKNDQTIPTCWFKNQHAVFNNQEKYGKTSYVVKAVELIETSFSKFKLQEIKSTPSRIDKAQVFLVIARAWHNSDESAKDMNQNSEQDEFQSENKIP